MPIDTTPSNVATSALQAIPFGSVIGGPLVAGVEAQSLAAQATWKFIQEVGLTDDKKAVNVDFIYFKDGRETKLIVPLLTIVPIPFFAIDQMTIDFKANISASASSVQEQKSSQEFKAGNETSASASGWFGGFKADTKFYANYSSKKDSTATQDSKYSVEYTMDVHVNASQHDMPAGLASILNILQSSIDSTIPEANLQVSPNSLVVADPLQDENLVVTVTAFDQKGMRAKTIDVTAGDKTSPEPEGTVTAKPSTPKVPTDKNGTAEFTIKYTKPTSQTTTSAQRLKLDFTAKINGQDVKEQVLIVIPAIPPAPSKDPKPDASGKQSTPEDGGQG